MEAGAAAEKPRVPERLLRRIEQRQREAEKKRQEKVVVTEEKSGYFSASFGQERAAIEEALSGAGGAELLEDVAGRIQGLQKLLNDSVMFLPSYDTSQAQKQLTHLQSALDTRRQQIQPKKKFAFKCRKKEGPSTSAVQPAAPQPAAPGKAILAQPVACGFQGLSSQALFMGAQEIRQKNVQLSQLQDCTVTLTGSPATLRLRELSGCRVLCGPVSTSVFVDNCCDCLFAFPCHQLRTHASRDSCFYLHVTSRSIIEDCTGLMFAPFTWSYPEILADYEASGLDRSRNNWYQVDDFNWLARGVKSPNWQVIPKDKMVTHWD